MAHPRDPADYNKKLRLKWRRCGTRWTWTGGHTLSDYQESYQWTDSAKHRLRRENTRYHARGYDIKELLKSRIRAQEGGPTKATPVPYWAIEATKECLKEIELMIPLLNQIKLGVSLKACSSKNTKCVLDPVPNYDSDGYVTAEESDEEYIEPKPESESEMEVEQITIDDIDYFLNEKTGDIYDMNTQEIVGKSKDGEHTLF